MPENKNITPPKWAQGLLAFYCRPELLEDLQGDLNEYFARNVKSKGLKKAQLIYVIDVFKFFRSYTVRKPKLLNLLISWIMIGSYIKTSGRNIVRNKLFSTINIVGLAVSMSVGLLMIGMMSDLLSYDNFHEKKDRIFRVITISKRTGEPSMTLASSSVKAGKKIREAVSGIEDVTNMYGQFGGDAVIGEKTIPVGGIWADESFSKVFTFPYLQGDAATALKEPYSIVLTEASAKKLFGEEDALGKSVKFDTTLYVVTGVLKDLPKLSHIHFEVLVSFATAEITQPGALEGDFFKWSHFYSAYTYFTLAPGADINSIQQSLDKISQAENKPGDNVQVELSAQPLSDVVLGENKVNQIGPTMDRSVLWVFGGLAFVVIVSACFNYTNLSIARSLRRTREIGIRKVIGAFKSHVMLQFLAEAVIIALLALAFACLLFVFLRSQFLSIDSYFDDLVALRLTPQIVLYFVGFAIVTGIIAGILPAFFFSRIKALTALRDLSSLRPFRHLSMRKVLIVIQYTFSLMFITATVIGYKQYKGFLTYDLGFTTDNVLNINLQGNKADLLINELSTIPAITSISRSRLITTIGNIWGTQVNYKTDSINVGLNYVDDKYVPLLDYELLAGNNFAGAEQEGGEVMVNEQFVKAFNIGNGDLSKVIGEPITIYKKQATIVAVMKDFHYGTLDNKITPTVFQYSKSPGGHLNLKVSTNDPIALMNRIDIAWKKIDKIHPIKANFYNEQINLAYRQYSAMLKIVGFLSFLAIIISSLGLLGMIVFTTETKLKEISVRKVLGASEAILIYLLGKGFVILLIISALIAVPSVYLLFDRILLADFAYHSPIGLVDLVGGVTVVFIIAAIMIGLQTLKAARTNPAKVLRNE